VLWLETGAVFVALWVALTLPLMPLPLTWLLTIVCEPTASMVRLDPLPAMLRAPPPLAALRAAVTEAARALLALCAFAESAAPVTATLLGSVPHIVPALVVEAVCARTSQFAPMSVTATTAATLSLQYFLVDVAPFAQSRFCPEMPKSAPIPGFHALLDYLGRRFVRPRPEKTLTDKKLFFIVRTGARSAGGGLHCANYEQCAQSFYHK